MFLIGKPVDMNAFILINVLFLVIFMFSMVRWRGGPGNLLMKMMMLLLMLQTMWSLKMTYNCILLIGRQLT